MFHVVSAHRLPSTVCETRHGMEEGKTRQNRLLPIPQPCLTAVKRTCSDVGWCLPPFLYAVSLGSDESHPLPSYCFRSELVVSYRSHEAFQIMSLGRTLEMFMSPMSHGDHERSGHGIGRGPSARTLGVPGRAWRPVPRPMMQITAGPVFGSSSTAEAGTSVPGS